MQRSEWLSAFEARRIERMLAALFLGRTRPGEGWQVEGHRDPDWLALALTLASADDTFCYRVEARVRRRSARRSDDALKAVLLDLLGALFEGYLARGARQPFSGANWEAASADGVEVWLRGQERDPRAEAAAAALLDADASRHGRAEAAAAAASAAAADAVIARHEP